MQGRLGRRRRFFDAPLSAGGPFRCGTDQAIDLAGQRRQGAGAIGRRERRQRRRSQRIELRRQGEDGVNDGRVRVRHASAEFRQICGRAGNHAETRRLRVGEIEAAGGAIILGPQRCLVDRRQSLVRRPGSGRAGGSRGARRRSSSPGAISSGNTVPRLRPDIADRIAARRLAVARAGSAKDLRATATKERAPPPQRASCRRRPRE